jgi:hypothetical protein
MAFAELVYPGAVHSRLHHALGAYHLMYNALHELKSKGDEITSEEEQGAKIAILLHDIGQWAILNTRSKVVLGPRRIPMKSFLIAIITYLNQCFNNRLSIAT